MDGWLVDILNSRFYAISICWVGASFFNNISLQRKKNDREYKIRNNQFMNAFLCGLPMKLIVVSTLLYRLQVHTRSDMVIQTEREVINMLYLARVLFVK